MPSNQNDSDNESGYNATNQSPNESKPPQPIPGTAFGIEIIKEEFKKSNLITRINDNE